MGKLELIQNLEFAPLVFDGLKGRHFPRLEAQYSGWIETVRRMKTSIEEVMACGVMLMLTRSDGQAKLKFAVKTGTG